MMAVLTAGGQILDAVQRSKVYEYLSDLIGIEHGETPSWVIKVRSSSRPRRENPGRCDTRRRGARSVRARTVRSRRVSTMPHSPPSTT